MHGCLEVADIKSKRLYINEKRFVWRKILMITSRADYGGGPEHVYRLMITLQKEYDIYIACPKDVPYWNRYAEIVGLERMLEIPHRKVTLRHVLKTAKFVKQNNIDIVHSHGKGAGIYGRIVSLFTRFPCVHTYHGIHIESINKLSKMLNITLERILAWFTSTLISVSESEASIVRKYRLCNTTKLNVIVNGVVIPKESSKLPDHYGRYKIISMTRFDNVKNSELAIEILNIINSKYPGRFELHFLGQGEGMDHVKKKAQEMDVAEIVYFHGAVDNVEKHYRETFCYLSTSKMEGMPLALLESFSYGIPVVASNVPGNKDIIEHNVDGYLYDINTAENAALYIIKLANERTVWRSISEMARKKAIDKFSVEKMATQISEIYKKL